MMIDPRDIFDAHRVVRSPDSYRGPLPLRNPFPVSNRGTRPLPLRSPFDADRRSTALRVIRLGLLDRTAPARSRLAQAAADARARIPRRG